ncbi:hypothetical protein F4604DRAFT_1931248 [Suillus subluteus]|nr:hypothetical protein F4604DRAFT_1931248 [Suillus subluteus]
MSSPTILSKVKMLQDVIFAEINGVELAWDTYCFILDIESLGPKRVVFRIKTPAASGNGTSEEHMSVKEEAINVKIEDQDVGLTLSVLYPHAAYFQGAQITRKTHRIPARYGAIGFDHSQAHGSLRSWLEDHDQV